MLESVADVATIIGVAIALIGLFFYGWHRPTPQIYLVWQPTYSSTGGTILRLENRGPGVAYRIKIFYDLPKDAYEKFGVMIYGFGDESDEFTEIEDRTLELDELLPNQYVRFGFISNADKDNLGRWGYRSPFPVRITYKYKPFYRRLRYPIVQHPSIPSPEKWEQAIDRMSTAQGVAPDVIMCFGPDIEYGWVDVGLPGEIYR